MAFNLALKSKTAEASFSISRDLLARFITAVNCIVPKKTTVPILKFVRIYYKDGDGFIRVTDTECYADLSLKGLRGSGEIDLAVEYATLENMLAKAPRSSGVFLVEREGTALVFKDNCLTCGKIAGVPGKDCPTLVIPIDTDEGWITMTEYDIKYIHKYISPLCIEDTQYTALNSILFESSDANHGFAATDRHALIYTSLVQEPTFRRAIPCKAFKAMSLLGTDCNLMLHVGHYSFEGKQVSVYGAFVGGTYPDFHHIVDAQDKFTTVLKVNVKSLRDELKRLSVIVKPTTKGFCPVMLTYGTEYLGVQAVPSDYAFDNYTGVKMDALALLKLMERFDDNSPVVFKATRFLTHPTVWTDGKATTLFAPMS